jgi:HEAT repeat protein
MHPSARLLVALLVGLAHPGCGGEPAPPPEPALPPEVASLIHDLVEGTDLAARKQAHDRLPAHGALVVEPLARALDRPEVDDAVGAWIAEVLGDLGPDAAGAAPALARRLGKGGECSATTSWALGQIGAEGAPHLVAALESPHANTRTWAAQALGDVAYHLADADAAVVASLVRALGDPLPEVRASIAYALADIGAAATTAGPRLALLLEDEIPEVAAAAGTTLLSLGVLDEGVLSRLRARLSGRGEDEALLREELLEAIAAQVESDAVALPLLRLGLAAGEDPEVRRVALESLLSRGVDDAALVAEFARSAREDLTHASLLAMAGTLVEAGPNGRRASIPLWARALEWSPSTDERVAAAEGLADAGAEEPARAEAIRALRAHGADEPAVREAIADALRTLDAE